MRTFVALVFVAACADRTPPQAVVSLALPLPSASASTAPVVERRDTPPIKDDGDFSSERGMVHLTAEPDGVVAGSFPENGVVACKQTGDVLACRWYQTSSEGRATLRRKSDGRLEGTWGNESSDDDGGSWTLVPIARGGPFEGAWDSNWGTAMIHATARGVHIDYATGTIECEQHGKRLQCTWTEGSSSGGAQLTIETSRVIRGRWGNGSSATDGGSWMFVKR